MSRRSAFMLACVSSSAAACISAGVPNGARVATVADRAGQVERGYVCESPLSFKLAGGRVVEPSDGNVDPANDAVVYKSASGLVLVEGKQTITNHWGASDGDHFFAWYGSGIGQEVVVANDRQSAVAFRWANQPGDGEAYGRQTYPDGTTRPAGAPTHVSTCTPRDTYDAIKKAGKRPFLAVQAVPMPGVVEGKPAVLKVMGCQRKGAEQLANAGSEWGWVPSKVQVVEGATSVAYLSFDRNAGGLAIWAVPMSATGEFGAQLGAVRFRGKAWREGDLRVHVSGELTAGGDTVLDCYFGK